MNPAAGGQNTPQDAAGGGPVSGGRDAVNGAQTANLPPFTVGPLAKAIYAAAHQCSPDDIEAPDTGQEAVQLILDEHCAWTYRGITRQRAAAGARIASVLAYLHQCDTDDGVDFATVEVRRLLTETPP